MKLVLREIITGPPNIGQWRLHRLNTGLKGGRRKDVVGVRVFNPVITGLVNDASILDGVGDTLQVLNDLERKAHSVVLFHVSCSFIYKRRSRLTQPMWQCMSQTPGLEV